MMMTAMAKEWSDGDAKEREVANNEYRQSVFFRIVFLQMIFQRAHMTLTQSLTESQVAESKQQR